VSIPTADGLKLAGTFYAAPAGKKGPCVLMLHDFQFGNIGRKGRDWVNLATGLQKQGCAVLTFDFRGCGDNRNSKDLLPATFLRHPANMLVQGGFNPQFPRGMRGQTTQSAINSMFFPPRYLPWLVQDVVAARLWLDLQHDAGKVNSSNLVLIGEGEGARLGTLWLATEARRYRTADLVPGVAVSSLYESRDLRGAVWIDVRGAGKVAALRDAPSVRKQLMSEKAWPPMLYLYNQNNPGIATQVDEWTKTFPQSLRAPGARKVVNQVGFAGLISLLSAPGATQEIQDFVAALIRSGEMKPPDRRNTQANEYTWHLGNIRRQAKARFKTTPLLAPLEHWGFKALPGK
jgi:pimeloyl-ACP methyl ester carboxylesterase